MSCRIAWRASRQTSGKSSSWSACGHGNVYPDSQMEDWLDHEGEWRQEMASTYGMWHVNPATCKPGVCRAKRNCPFGGLSEHYKSPEAATRAAEAAAMADVAMMSKATGSEVADVDVTETPDWMAMEPRWRNWQETLRVPATIWKQAGHGDQVDEWAEHDEATKEILQEMMAVAWGKPARDENGHVVKRGDGTVDYDVYSEPMGEDDGFYWVHLDDHKALVWVDYNDFDAPIDTWKIEARYLGYGEKGQLKEQAIPVDGWQGKADADPYDTALEIFQLTQVAASEAVDKTLGRVW